MPEERLKSATGSEIDLILRALAATPEIPAGCGALFEAGGTSRFTALRRLGAGGFGVVWLVRDLVVGAEVALKTLPLGRPELVYRLKREFRSLANLRHTNLVSFYELFADEDRCFFTMEYIPGPTLLAYVRPAGTLDSARLRSSLAQLVRGLATLHAKGMLHRDVKPSNVLVTPEGRVVLLDFGLATEIEESGIGRSAELAGTPQYMSPEHALGQALSPSSDWYAVGVVLYEALAGRLPFAGTWADLIEEKKHLPPSPACASSDAEHDLIELCMALLRPNPGERPTVEEISRTLCVDHAVAAASVARDNEAALVGRERELGLLRNALRVVQTGRGVTALVEGASGLGKTALAEQFLTEARRHAGALVLRGRCYERERVPYQGIDSLIDDLCRFLAGLESATVEGLLPRHVRALVRLFPVLERVSAVASLCAHGRPESPDQQESRRQAFQAAGELLARIADRHVLALHIDDLQWGDLDTASLLKEILRGPDAPCMLLILSYRSEHNELSPCLGSLRDEIPGEVVRVPVEPLGAADSVALVRRILADSLSATEAERLAAESGGSPFFIQELSRRVRHSERSAGEQVDLKAALRDRIGELPEAARRLLEVIAVAGHPIREDLARRAAGFAGPPWDAWRILADERLVRFAGPGDRRLVETLHDRIRETVIATLTSGRAVECHRGLASSLEQDGQADLDVLATHYEAAGQKDRARELAGFAAQQAERALAFDRAARLYQRALALGPPSRAEQAALRTSLARALANAGRGVLAAKAYLDAAALVKGEARAEVRRQASQQLLFAGRVDEGRRLAAEGLREAGLSLPRTPRRALVSLLLRRAMIRVRGLRYRERAEVAVPPARLALMDHLWALSRGLSMVDAIRGSDLAARYVLLAFSAGEARRVAKGLALEAAHASSIAPFARATQRRIARLSALDDRLEDPNVHAYRLLVSGVRAFCGSEWSVAVSACDASEQAFREGCTGVAWEIWTMQCFGNFAFSYLGRWRELGRRVDASLADARERGSAYGIIATCLPLGMTAWLARGELEATRRFCSEAMASWSVEGFHLQHYWFLMAECHLDLYQGDGAAAWRRVRDAWADLARSLLLRIPLVRVQMLQVRGACALGAAAQEPALAPRQSLLAEAATAARKIERINLPFAAPLALLLRAAHSAQLGNTSAALGHLDHAIAQLDRLGMAGYAAAARFRRAQLIASPPPSVFLPGEDVKDAASMMRMLAPGFPQ